MCKRIVSAVLALCLMAAVAFPVLAEETVLKINTAEEFLQFAESCRLDSYSLGLQVVLETDIDLTGMDFQGVPVFSGSFDGQGHTISGLILTGEGSAQGLFRYLTETAQVTGLTVKGQLHPTGSRSQVGGVAGVNAGSITNCHFAGSISGGEHIGGITGCNRVTGLLEGCTVAGEIHGGHFVGGLAGSNEGVIRGGANTAQINVTPQQNSVEISDITMDSLLNTESVNTVTDIGGIAGSSSGVIKECENRGNVGYPQMGYNIGGIVGSQSGYLTACQNYGNIQGRKEVGGIAGQLEPALLVEFSTDTLQVLEGQLDDLSVQVGQAAGNAQENASAVTGHMQQLQQQVQSAQDALQALQPDSGKPLDPDALLAAQNALSAALQAMPGTLENITSAAQGTATGLSQDLNGLTGKLAAMQKTLDNASQQLGGSLVDVSDADTEADLTGKVEGCTNEGAVLADLNAGGIAGLMGAENDLDVWEDWEQSGSISLNFAGKVRVVIVNCENRGAVTCKKQNGGGIVGWQTLGLVKQCRNTGTLDSENAGYVGGIAGWSRGYLRSSYAKCRLRGATNVGGIAGSGTVVTDCISMVKLESGKEKLGAVLGAGDTAELQNNQYLVIDRDLGAVDGISYNGKAEPVELAALLELPNLPELFQAVIVRFVQEDGTVTELSLTPGSSLSPEQIPQIPEKKGYTAQYQGLAEADLEKVLFDVTFPAVYAPYRTVIESQQTGKNGLPVVLAEGSFTDSAVVTAEKSTAVPTLQWGQTHLETWNIQVQEGGTKVRLLAPGEDAAVVLVKSGSSWKEIPHSRQDSYLVFSLEGTDMTVAVVRAADYSFLYYILAGVLLIALVVTVLLIKKRRKNTKKEQ